LLEGSVGIGLAFIWKYGKHQEKFTLQYMYLRSLIETLEGRYRHASGIMIVSKGPLKIHYVASALESYGWRVYLECQSLTARFSKQSITVSLWTMKLIVASSAQWVSVLVIQPLRV